MRSINKSRFLSHIKFYTILAVIVVVGYALFVSGLIVLVGKIVPINHPIIIGAIIFIFVVLFNPLKERLHTIIYSEINKFPPTSLYLEQIQDYSKEIFRLPDVSGIILIFRSTIEKNFSPKNLHIFLMDPVMDQYKAINNEDDQPTTDLLFSKDNPLIQELNNLRGAIYFGENDYIPSNFQTEKASLALLGTEVLIPLHGESSLIGWVSLGKSKFAGKYSGHDIQFLEALSEHTALAIERGLVVENLENRGREMDILSRISQGVNITLQFDDILELIYAQTSQLIPLNDFRITLVQDNQQNPKHVFIVERDERIKEKENLELPSKSCLDLVVINTQRSLLTNQYEDECRRQSVTLNTRGIISWMGVPLNAGARTIGAISLSHQDPSFSYSIQHLSLFQAIADLTAAAIVKSRLLADSERKASQLGSLNEIARNLTSTLEIKPLLNLIMASATNILNCEAGSLLTIDDNTGELIFEVTVGPVAEGLIGKKLPAGTGVVGKVAEQGTPIIINEVRKSQYWYSETDKSTGFVTRDVLVVPMQVKNETIGVIEVINKRDGAPFNQEDQNLLTTFTNQASIAIENARLYTQTDAALRSRIDEMSTMQRIVRELNSNLDYQQSVQITLKWSIRQSGADAALLGTLIETNDEPYIQLQAISTLAHDTEVPSNKSGKNGVPIELTTVTLPVQKKSISGGIPFVENLADPTIEHSGVLLTDAKTQLIIPISRQSEIIAVLLLESIKQDAFSDEVIIFLDRLSDHSAIAISNAQLYKDLQAANMAKTDFISLVSHELRTPMTSIKGYTDLLAQGNAGEINDIQAKFLQTIRTNVDRMSTLVSDLADISRIEVGRMRLEYSAIPVIQLVDEVEKSFRTQINNKQQELVWEIPDDLPEIWGDHQRMVQILTNLISNAHKYTPSGGQIRIAAEAEFIQPNIDVATDVVLIEVTDNGIGISPADQINIFQKFFRADTPTVQESPGTGLGLNITRHLVEMQGGNIWFSSEVGVGTVFSFTIPIYSSLSKQLE